MMPPFAIRPDPGALSGLPGSFVKTIWCDLDAAADGDGSEASPYNHWRGSAVGHTDVVPGTRVLVRGTLKTTDNYLPIRQGGTAGDPVYYVLNDPSWGLCTIESADDLASAPCTDMGAARGAPDWTNLVHGVLPDGTGADDCRRGGYWGPKRLAGRMSIFPSQSDDDWGDYNHYLKFDTLTDLYWHPEINEAAPVFDAAKTRGRLRIAVTPGDSPEREAQRKALRDAVTADQTPIWQQRIFPNVWRQVPCYRGDGDGTPNSGGDYLLAEYKSWGNAPTDGNLLNYGRVAILNLAAFVDRPGRYAFGLDAGDPWFVGWPAQPGLGFARSNGGAGIQIMAGHLWIYGGRFQGFGKRGIEGVAPRPYYYANQVTIRSSTAGVRIERMHFGPHMPIDSRDDAAIIQLTGVQTDFVVRRCTFDGTLMARGITSGTLVDSVIEQNDLRNVGGSNIATIGGVDVYTRNLTIRSNLLRSIPDIHGNGLTNYADHFGLRITGNVVVGSSRPLTAQRNTDGSNPADRPYDEATHGTPYAYIAFNRFVADSSWDSSQYALRLAGRVKNAVLEANFFGSLSSVSGQGALASSAGNADDIYANDNIVVGRTDTVMTAALAAGSGNSRYAETSPEGISLVEAALVSRPALPVGAYDGEPNPDPDPEMPAEGWQWDESRLLRVMA